MARLLCALVFACFALLATGSTFASDLVVFATTSTTEAMTQATKKFTAESHIKVALRFASPGVLARRVEAGEKPHILVLDGKTWMDRLAAHKALAAGTRHLLFSNRLVLITHRDFPHTLQIAKDSPIRELIGDSKFAIADPKVDPAGQLAVAALKSMAVLAGLREKLQIAPDDRAALRLISQGKVVAGIVYATDSRISDQINLSGVFLRSMHPPIIYEIAVDAARNGSSARRLYAFLLSKSARDIYDKLAFVLE